MLVMFYFVCSIGWVFLLDYGCKYRDFFNGDHFALSTVDLSELNILKNNHGYCFLFISFSSLQKSFFYSFNVT